MTISSVILRVNPDKLPQIKARLGEFPGVEYRGLACTDPTAGRTIDADDSRSGARFGRARGDEYFLRAVCKYVGSALGQFGVDLEAVRNC